MRAHVVATLHMAMRNKDQEYQIGLAGAVYTPNILVSLPERCSPIMVLVAPPYRRGSSWRAPIP
jgi:hypothetical protein